MVLGIPHCDVNTVRLRSLVLANGDCSCAQERSPKGAEACSMGVVPVRYWYARNDRTECGLVLARR